MSDKQEVALIKYCMTLNTEHSYLNLKNCSKVLTLLSEVIFKLKKGEVKRAKLS